MHQLQPAIGQWYRRCESGRKFEVVDIDDDAGTIELQDEEGLLDEIDIQAWSAVDLELTAQPTDLTSVFDDIGQPDEADGGDAVQLDSPEIKTQHVASEEQFTAAEYDDGGDDSDWDKGMETPRPAREILDRPPRS